MMLPRPHAARTLALATLLLILSANLLVAQTASPNGAVEAGRQALMEAEQAHLWRVTAWGGLNVAGGLALALASPRSTRPARWSFGMMSAGWGVVNVGIGAVALATASAPAASLDAVLGAERTFHDVLLLNLGLNVGYAGVGAAMLMAGYRDVSHPAAWRGYGSALILQGAGLLVLDSVAFLASRTRLGDLLDATVSASAHVAPGRVALTLMW
jgi:hypothetical protein